jgi:hypothetical protein
MENKKVIIENTFNEDEFNKQIINGNLSETEFIVPEWVENEDEDDDWE